MKKIVVGIVFLLTLAGCAKEQSVTQKSASVTPIQEVKPIESAPTTIPVKAVEVVTPEAAKQEAVAVQEKVMDAATETAPALEDTGLQVSTPVAILQEMQAKVKEATQQKVLSKPVEGAEGIIAENKWGFSIYDQKTGTEVFYTSKGVLLGEKKR